MSEQNGNGRNGWLKAWQESEPLPTDAEYEEAQEELVDWIASMLEWLTYLETNHRHVEDPSGNELLLCSDEPPEKLPSETIEDLEAFEAARETVAQYHGEDEAGGADEIPDPLEVHPDAADQLTPDQRRRLEQQLPRPLRWPAA